jgi:glucose-6-phosphate isomerase
VDVFQLERLAREAARLGDVHLRELMADEPRRAVLVRRCGPLLVDLSRQRLDATALDLLGGLAIEHGWETARDAMFRGDAINHSERRAVLHTALRASASALPPLAPPAVLADVAATLDRMEALVAAVHGGQGDAFDLAPGITDVVQLGIGGSDLGPRLAVQALTPFATGAVRCHFLPNVDGLPVARLLATLDPKRTLVLLVSKSFTTQETLLNGHALRDWIVRAYAGDVAAANRHFVAVSANVEAASAFGIPGERVLPMRDSVGGRFSVWSAVGLVLALAVGMPRFREFLAGAAAMDDHFRSAPWRDNLPLLLALTGVWNRDALGFGSSAVVPYHDDLRELPAWLQQLEMESLGKSVATDGSAATAATAPVVWGGVGTNAQHAFFQALHQGSDVVPVDFIGVIRPSHALAANHQALLANLVAQGAALALGRSTEDALAAIDAGTQDERRALAAQRTFPGNRPSTTILLDELTPHGLGALLALYEHKVFVQGLLWGVNAFDQWGVELGKTLAARVGPALAGDHEAAGFDPVTRALIDVIRSRR